MALDIAVMRLESQLLANSNITTPKAIVSHFGAMQAQDYPMSKWAIGARLTSATENDVEKALDNNEIIRTHVLRPTWHLVAADDIHWMLELTAPNIVRQMNSTNRQLGLDAKIFSKSNGIIGKTLESNNHLTREELMQILSKSGINTEGHRSSHLMFAAELDSLVCNGIRKGKKHTYALLDEKVKNRRNFSRPEALSELALRYFTSHGPATVSDFNWWSGLSVAESRIGAESVRGLLDTIEADGKVYFMRKGVLHEKAHSVLFLPSFDEFLISYKDRSASISPEFSRHAFTNNGIFKPIIVIDGKVTGIWKRTLKKDKIGIEIFYFIPPPKKYAKKIIAAAKRYGDFMEMNIEIVTKDSPKIV